MLVLMSQSFMTGGTLIIEGSVDIHLGTHMEGGKIILKGNANRRVGGQLVKGEIYVFGNINVMMPGYKKPVRSILRLTAPRPSLTNISVTSENATPRRKARPFTASFS